MSYRRKSKQRFVGTGFVEMQASPFKQALGLREGAPVRAKLRGLWGVPNGTYRGTISSVGQSAFTGNDFARVVVTKAPAVAGWLVGRPLYLAPRLLVALPSKRS